MMGLTILFFFRCWFNVVLKIRSFRVLDTILCSRPLVWLFSQFSPAWDAVQVTVQLTLEFGCICLFVIIGPTD
jgi:hypothetical protein